MAFIGPGWASNYLGTILPKKPSNFTGGFAVPLSDKIDLRGSFSPLGSVIGPLDRQQPSINLPERLQDDRILEFAKSRVASPGERYGPAMSFLGCQGVGHANRLLGTSCLFRIACYDFAILRPLESE